MADSDQNEQALRRVMELEQTLMTLWDMFTHAPRGGADIDKPLGSRYIQISDTMAKDINKRIDRLLASGRVSAIDTRTNPQDASVH